jgi:hypothetical protein
MQSMAEIGFDERPYRLSGFDHSKHVESAPDSRSNLARSGCRASGNELLRKIKNYLALVAKIREIISENHEGRNHAQAREMLVTHA